ncbi:thioredoxin family protein [Bacillus sp. 03113]|uniref:thioredoxin family protein n=1 Tax=Bacillus sp. 03113 TaxID=2578211 RepID=UPI0011413E4C|nr:thioredoxin family protein [Bacillus sp. 03113]
MKLLDWHQKGMHFNEYVENMKVNRDEFQYIYNNVTFSDHVVSFLQRLINNKCRVIVLTADWCTDAMLCVPILQRMFEITEYDSRFLIRDENLELMDQYLTNGTSRSIPIFIFINDEGDEQTVWGPRSSEVETIISDLRNRLPLRDSNVFEQKQKEMYAAFRSKLVSDPSVWESVINSVVGKLKQKKLSEC